MDMVTVTPQVKPGQVLCAPVPTNKTITLSGTGTDPSANGRFVVNWNDGFDFKGVTCGSTAPAQTAKLAYTGAAGMSTTVTSVSLAGGASSPFTITPSGYSLSIPLPAPTHFDVTVTPKPMPASSSTQLHLYNDVLSIVTFDTAGYKIHNIFLYESAGGAIYSVSPAMVTFPPTTVGNRAAIRETFYLINNGADPTPTLNLTVTGDTADFPGIGSQLFTPPAGTPSTIIASFTPTATGMRTATVTLNAPANAPLCAPLPSGVTLSGMGN
jgi:hypothetical protein